jgi:hypothetical protein
MMNYYTIFNHESYMAICLVVFSFLLPIFVRDLRKSLSVMLGYWFVIFFHQVVALLNIISLTTGQRKWIPGSMDANTFHFIAKELALNGEIIYRGTSLSVPLSPESFLKGGPFYYELLGTAYKWFGVSHLFGEQLTILTFALSCIIFLRIKLQLGIERYNALSLIFFGAMPSMVLHGSVTLREPYQVLFFMLAVYYGMKISVRRKLSLSSIFLMVVSALLMAVFHEALLIYAVFLIFMFSVWLPRPLSRVGNIKKIHLIAMVAIPLFLFCIVVVSGEGFVGLRFIQVLFKDWDLNYGLFLRNMASWRHSSGTIVGRATYDIVLDTASIFTMTFSVIKIYAYYLFAPFPWMVKNILDIYGLLESILRMTLIYFSLKHWFNACGMQRRRLGLMLVLYISMSLMWAMGTTNYGTAMRHNMVTWWIIVILGVPSLMVKLQHFCFGMMSRYRFTS